MKKIRYQFQQSNTEHNSTRTDYASQDCIGGIGLLGGALKSCDCVYGSDPNTLVFFILNFLPS